ncbi:hypothetical protein D3C72_1733950 [compost metagenome]
MRNHFAQALFVAVAQAGGVFAFRQGHAGIADQHGDEFGVVPFEVARVSHHERAQPGRAAAGRGHVLANGLGQAVQHGQDDGVVDVLLGGVIVVDGGLGRPDGGGQVGHGAAVVAAAGEELGGFFQNAFARRRQGGRAAGAGALGGGRGGGRHDCLCRAAREAVEVGENLH